MPSDSPLIRVREVTSLYVPQAGPFARESKAFETRKSTTLFDPLERSLFRRRQPFREDPQVRGPGGAPDDPGRRVVGPVVAESPLLHPGPALVESGHELRHPRIELRGPSPRRRVDRTTYMKLADRWNPASFDPHLWLDLAEEAGMEYAVLTTKHHDGFCLWDTKETAFNTMNTPYGKDNLKLNI